MPHTPRLLTERLILQPLVLTDADGNQMLYGTPPRFTADGHTELLLGAVKKLVAAKLGDNVPLGKPDLVGTPSAIVGPPR